MTDNVIALNRNYAPFVEDEYPAGESDIAAGHFLEVNASDKVIKHAAESAVGTQSIGLGILANVNKSDPAKDKGDAYASDENVHVLYVPIGGKVDAKLAAGGDLAASADANVSKWDVLEEADNGALKKVVDAASLTATQTEDVGSVGAGDTLDFTIAVAGAAAGDPVAVSPPSGLEADLTVTAFVSAADTVTVRVSNPTAGAIDPASGDYTVIVLNQGPQTERGALYQALEASDNSAAAAGVANQVYLKARRFA